MFAKPVIENNTGGRAGVEEQLAIAVLAEVLEGFQNALNVEILELRA